MKKQIICLLSFGLLGSLFIGANANYKETLALNDVSFGSDFEYSYDYTKYEAYSDEWKEETYESHFMTISPDRSSLGIGENGHGCDGEGYVIYKYTAPTNKAFSSLITHWRGRVFHNNDTEPCSENECTCGLELYTSTDGEYYVEAGYEAPGIYGQNGIGFKHELTDYVHGSKTVYVKFVIDSRSWDWINIDSLKIYGTYCNDLINVTSVDTHNNSNTRIQNGETIDIDFTVTNNSNSEFNGLANIIAPSTYFEEEDKSIQISVPANESKDFTLKLKITQAGYTNYYLFLADGAGEIFDKVEVQTFARGEGVYRFDTHSHTPVSDGRNTFLEHYTQAHEKGLSGAFTTDHSAPNPGDDTMAIEAAAELSKVIDEDFIAYRGSEVTTQGNFHILSYNFKTEYPSTTPGQQVIDGVINQGGLSYLAHPFCTGYLNPSLGDDPTRVDALNNMTGLELTNGETNMVRGWDTDFNRKNLEYWDRLNITGKKNFYGTCGSDAHDAIIIGNVVCAFNAKDLTREDILDSYSSGKFYITNGPQVNMTLDDKTFGETVRIKGSKQTNIHIEAYDPYFPIEKVVLYKFNINPNDIDTAFANGRKDAEVIFEKGEKDQYFFNYDAQVTVNEDTFYRVEVYSKQGSLEWSRPNYPGFAYCNPIFIGKEISNMEVTSLPKNLTTEQNGAFDFSGLTITATYYDSTQKEIKGFRVKGQDSSKMGKVTIYFSFENYVFNIEFEVLEQQGVVQVKDGKISFFRDYTKYAAYDTTWAKDSAVDSISGYIGIGANAKGVGPGKKNVSSSGEGYVTYRVEVPDGNVINELAVDIVGRIYHSSSNSACAAGTCGCYFNITISLDGGCTFEKVYEFDFKDGHSTWGQKFNIDLNDYIGNSKCVLVRVNLCGKSWDWICIQSLRLTGTYIEGQSIPVAEKGSVLIGSGKISYDKNFTSLAQYDSSWAKEKAVYKTDGDLTISPSTRCLGVGKQNTSSSGSGSVYYLVDLPDNNVIDKLNYTVKGRIYHSSSSSVCSAGNCTCAFKIFISVDGGYVYKQVYDHKFNFTDSSFNKTLSFDLDSYVQNRNNAIIRMYMSGRSWDWVGITDVSISGTYKEGTPIEDVILQTRVDQNYYKMGIGSDAFKETAYSYKNVCIGRGDKPWLSIDGNDGTFDGKTGELIYKVDSDAGKFEDLSITGTARVFTYQGSAAYFAISYSLDGETYSLLKSYAPTTSGSEMCSISLSLTDVLNGAGTVYIKIEMVSGFWDWVCVKDLHILGYSVSKHISVNLQDTDGNTLLETDKFVKYSTLDITPYEKEGYKIVGVFTDKQCTTPLLDYKLTEDVNNLYLKYEAIEYDIEYINTELENDTYTINDEFILPEPVAAEGKVFEGWYLDEDFIGEPITKIEKGSTGDVKVYARFIDDPVLVQYKIDAIDDLSNYVNEEDYRADEVQEIRNILQQANSSINECTNKEAIDLIVEDAKEQIDLLLTNDDYILIAAKEIAIQTLENYVDLNKYVESDKNAIMEIISEAEASIALATTINDVEAIVEATKKQIDTFKTKDVVELENAKKNALEEVDKLYKEYSSKNISDSNKVLLESLTNNAKTVITSATSVDAVNAALAAYKESIKAIPEITQKSGCGNTMIISSVLVSIASIIGLLFISKKDR